MTSRDRDKPLAARFVKFLASPQGAQIFASWGWMTPPADASPVEVRQDVTIVCGVDRNTSTNGMGLGLLRVKKLVEDYESTEKRQFSPRNTPNTRKERELNP